MFLLSRRTTLSVALIGLLSACATFHKTPEIKTPDWTLNAKVSVKHTQGKRDSAIINWKKQGNTFKINAFNSFSQPLFTLYSTPGFARIDGADGSRAEASSAKNLMQETLGWSIPASAIEAWVSGQLTGQETQIQRKHGQLISFQFQKFGVTLKNYRQFGHIELPSKIQLTNPQVNILFIVKSYERHH